MTRILFSPSAFRQSHGGVSRAFCRLHEEFIEVGLSSTAFGGLNSNEYLDKSTASALSLNTPAFRGRGRVSNFAFRTFIAAAREPAVVHETYFPKPYHVPGRHAVAVTILDLIHHSFRELPHSSVIIERQRAWLSKADVVFAISDATRDEAIDVFGLEPERTVTTHLGVDNVFFERGEIARPTESESPYFLFVGQRGGYKNWATAIAAFAEVAHEFDVSMVCAGGGAFNRAEVGLLQDLRVCSQVTQRSVDDDELPQLYANAVATVCPSRIEGFGLPSLESMASGTLVITSDHPAAREIVGNFGVRVSAMDVPEWSVALADALTKPRADRSLMEGHAKNFTWSRMARQTLSGYQAAHPGGSW